MCLCPHCLPFAWGPFLIVLPEILCFNLPCYVFLLQIVFSPALSREFRPYKPDPAPLLHICSTWDVQPNEVMMVGDSLKDDVSDILPKFFFDTLCCLWCLYQKDGSLLLRLKGWCDTIILSCVGELCDQCLSNGWLILWLVQVACGKRAGAFTCLLDEKGRYGSADFAELDLEPDYKVASLAEVHSLLETNFDLMPWFSISWWRLSTLHWRNILYYCHVS